AGERGDRRGQGRRDRGGRTRAREDPLRPDVSVPAGRVRPVLRARPGTRSHGEPGRGDRRHCRAVDRRAGHAADHADVPHRRHGAKLKKRDGQKGKSGGMVAEWDPYTIPILTETAGVVKFGDILEGVTMEEKLDERTGLSTKVIVDTKDVDKRPRVSIKDERGQTARIGAGEARYLLPVGAHLNVLEGQAVAAGDIIAKMPRETTKTKDITGGLPRVAELFEARKPKEF